MIDLKRSILARKLMRVQVGGKPITTAGARVPCTAYEPCLEHVSLAGNRSSCRHAVSLPDCTGKDSTGRRSGTASRWHRRQTTGSIQASSGLENKDWIVFENVRVMWACFQPWRADLQPPAEHRHGSRHPARTSTSGFCPSKDRGPQLQALGAHVRDTPRPSRTDCPSGWAGQHRSPLGELANHVAFYVGSCRFSFILIALRQAGDATLPSFLTGSRRQRPTRVGYGCQQSSAQLAALLAEGIQNSLWDP